MKTLKLYLDTETVNTGCFDCFYVKIYLQVDNLSMLWDTNSVLITYSLGF